MQEEKNNFERQIKLEQLHSRIKAISDVLGYSYELNVDLSDAEMSDLSAEISWDALENGKTFDVCHNFLEGEIDDVSVVAKHFVFAFTLSNNVLFDDIESKKKLALVPMGMNESDFWHQYSNVIEKLIELMSILSNKVNFEDQSILNLFQLTLLKVCQITVEKIRNKVKKRKIGEIIIPDIPSEVEQKLIHLAFRNNFEIKIKSRCFENQPAVALYDYIKVTDFAADYLSIRSQKTKYERKMENNLHDAEAFLQIKDSISIEDLDEIWKILMKNISNRKSGFRQTIIVLNARKGEPPVGEEMQNEIEDLLKLVNSESQFAGETDKTKYILAARICARFQKIHPMIDGNGRLGHVITNWFLTKIGLPKFSVPFSSFSTYADAVTDAINDPEDLYQLIHVMRTFSQKGSS